MPKTGRTLLVSDSDKKRVALMTKVKNLKEFILESDSKGLVIEHIYDY
jgi:hypothetical protein